MGSDRARLGSAKRIVIKVGTGVVASQSGQLALGRLGSLVEQVRRQRDAGREVIVVSSGAIGLGMERLGFAVPPTAVVDRQACAAAGQGALVAFYDVLFQRVGLTAAQVLLTEDDFGVRQRYLNLHATLDRLLALGAVPIINENDTVSAAELAMAGQVFGDNDHLSALVASGCDADALVLLSDVDGLYSAPPGSEGARLVSVFDETSRFELGPGSASGRGGMGAKVRAARIGALCGVEVVITSGFQAGVVDRVLAGETIGTWFPAQTGLNRRRRWLAFATAPAGRLVVNHGAWDAMVNRQASLLAPGVLSVKGDFEAGSVVSIRDERGLEFARGLCDRASGDVREGIGTGKRGKPVVHRDNVVVMTWEAR